MLSDVMVVIPLFLLGSAVGSFLNVVILRHIEGKPITGRSACPNCKRRLTWWELIPIFSFIVLGGRCKTCRWQLHLQYPIVELTVGILLLIFFIPLPDTVSAFTLSLVSFIIAGLLVILFMIDLRTFILPDLFIFLLGIAALARWTISRDVTGKSLLWGVVVGAGFILFLWLVTRGKGIGFGDVKLMIPLGMLFGTLGTAVLLFLAFTAGGLVGVLLLLARKATPKTAVPFGPFLAGTAIPLLIWPGFVGAFLNFLFPGYL